MMAPFDFKYWTRPTNYIGIPAQIVLSFFLANLQRTSMKTQTLSLSGKELAFSGLTSFSAAVGEEALFRGWIMPIGMKYTQSELLSNLMTSLVFGAAHFQTGYIPLSQTIIGFYLGLLAQKNEWQLGESIFNHFWFDFIIFTAAYGLSNSVERAQTTFYFPPLSLQF
jgi:membrane protease YdiL (CAAX protease family)